ncbi:suppressor of fused domain protein [Schlesneria paludicola]|uniref:suppressor of fused domain protein n=1 Tax=Schlesneria paludicola TaxID=360056 RepID=UPI0012F934CD|nr:suppressor of fused domain protein [Schlesneria paludicola]
MEKADWFERIWAHREDVLYPNFFGTQAEGIFTIPMQNLEKGGIADPRWASCGVIRFAPTAARNSWLYVSSGLSNEWFESVPDRAAVSGFGCEFVLETPTQDQWPIQRVHQIMCYQIALCLGQHPDSDPMTIGDRVPLGHAIDWGTSELKYLLVTEPIRIPPTFNQDSGRAAFLQLIGISETERSFAEQSGFDALIERLKMHDDFPTTDPVRKTLF